MGDLVMSHEDESYNALMEKQAFRVTELASAAWCMRKAREAQEAMARNNDYAQAMAAKYREWADKENERHAATIERMRGYLEPWVREQTTGKRRSVSLPDGTAGFRRTPQRIEYRDETAVVVWAEGKAPEKVVVKKTLPKAAAKELIEATGEVPECVDLIEGEDRFYMEAKEE